MVTRLGELLRGPTLRSLTGTAGVNAIALALGLITGVLTARGLEPGDRGLLVALVAWAGLSATFALVGLDEALIFGAQGHGRKARTLRRALARPAMAQATIGACALGGISWWLIRPAAVEEWLLVIVVALNVPLNTCALLALSVLRAEGRLREWNFIRIVPNFAYAGVVLLLVATQELTVELGLAGLVVGGALAALLAVRAVMGGELGEMSSLEEDEVIRFGRRLTLASLPSLLNPRVDQLATSIALAPAVLGVYSVSTAVASILLILGVSLEQVLFPRLVASEVERRRLLKWAGAAAALSALIALALTVAAPWMIEGLYGSDYRAAAEPLPLLLVAACLRVASSVLSAGLKAKDQLGTLTVANTIGLVAGLAAFLLLSDLGMIGIALAAMLGSIATAAVLLGAFVRGVKHA